MTINSTGPFTFKDRLIKHLLPLQAFTERDNLKYFNYSVWHQSSALGGAVTLVPTYILGFVRKTRFQRLNLEMI